VPSRIREKPPILLSKVNQALNEIVGQARQVAPLAAEGAGAARERSQGVAQVNRAVSEMDNVTQSNAAHAEESSAEVCYGARSSYKLDRAVR
jgi:methyl-accepting chemotaxis protein